MAERDTGQLNVKIDVALFQQFTARCKNTGRSQRQIVETLIEAWLAASEDTHVRHLDGSMCPLSELIKNLADEVRNYSAQPHRPALAGGTARHGE